MMGLEAIPIVNKYKFSPAGIELFLGEVQLPFIYGVWFYIEGNEHGAIRIIPMGNSVMAKGGTGYYALEEGLFKDRFGGRVLRLPERRPDILVFDREGNLVQIEIQYKLFRLLGDEGFVGIYCGFDKSTMTWVVCGEPEFVVIEKDSGRSREDGQV